MKHVCFRDLNLIDYKEAWEYQEKLFNQVTQNKLNDSGELQYLLFCEHPHVYTLGKSGATGNLLISPEKLASIGATYYHIDRGGDITYHGPGQIVAYPIFNLERLGLSLKTYIHHLEQVVIDCLARFDISADRLPNATGVWLEPGKNGHERKICAIGVRASRFVTMHGLALNVNTQLQYFNHIHPCGFVNKGVTSMQEELKKNVDIQKVKNCLLEKFSSQFGLEINPQNAA